MSIPRPPPSFASAPARPTRSSSPTFRGCTALEANERERALADLKVVQVEPGELLCRVGRPVTLLVRRHRRPAEDEQRHRAGIPITFTGLPPGGWFGEGTVIKREAYRYNIEALRRAWSPASTVDDLPLAARPQHPVQPLHRAAAQRAARPVHRGARDRSPQRPRRARRAQPRGAVPPDPLSRASARCCGSPSRSSATWSACRASASTRRCARCRRSGADPGRVRRRQRPRPRSAARYRPARAAAAPSRVR